MASARFKCLGGLLGAGLMCGTPAAFGQRVFMAVDGEQSSVATTGNTTVWMLPGTTRRVMLWVEDSSPPTLLNFYQIMIEWEAVAQPGATGSVTYSDDGVGGAQTQCDTINLDGGGRFGACSPDGFCNFHDAVHALTCFVGTNLCTCAGATTPGALCADDEASSCCDLNSDGVRDGSCLLCGCSGGTCSSTLTGFPSDVGGAHGGCTRDGFCNVHDRNHFLTCFGGSVGGSAAMDQARPDWVLAGLTTYYPLLHETPGSGGGFGMIGGLYSHTAGISIPGIRYLGEFDLVASPDATGEFHLLFVPAGAAPQGGTDLGDNQGSAYPINELQNLTIVIGSEGDCNGNGVPDETDISSGTSQDCNGNGIPDGCDIASGASTDGDGNGVPDECCRATDCADVVDNFPPAGPDPVPVRDDNCKWWQCGVLGSCQDTDVHFADMGGAFGACQPDGFVNVHDINHTLACFTAGDNACAEINIDAGGAFGLCAPDGFCNVHDANHARTKFVGVNICTCPLDAPAPQSPAPPAQRVAETELVLHTDRSTLHPRQVAAVHAVVATPLAALQAYQLGVTVSGGLRGHLRLVSITVDERKDSALGTADESVVAISRLRGQMFKLRTTDGGAPVPAGAVLATFHFEASADAEGTFVVDIDTGPGAQTYLIAPPDRPIEVTATRPAQITVAPGSTARRARSEQGPQSRGGE